MQQYWVLAFYHFMEIESPELEVKKLKKYFKNKDVRGRIYLSKEGINAQMSIFSSEGKNFIEWIKKDPLYQNVYLKVHLEKEHTFFKMTIKAREQLVAFDQKIDLANTGKHVSAKEWKKMLEEKDEDTILIDVRNDYEWKVGHFEGAQLPDCSSFREFPKYTENLKKKIDPKKTKIMMYCTGGIRCEYYSAYLKEEGFENIFQLDGGVIEYGLQEGREHWKGKLFVFDDRLTVDISNNTSQSISLCLECNNPCSTYYNCANMDCNELFICCADCIHKNDGCCSKKCKEKGVIRKYDQNDHPKPFRKIPFEEKKNLRNTIS